MKITVVGNDPKRELGSEVLLSNSVSAIIRKEVKAGNLESIWSDIVGSNDALMTEHSKEFIFKRVIDHTVNVLRHYIPIDANGDRMNYDLNTRGALIRSPMGLFIPRGVLIKYGLTSNTLMYRDWFDIVNEEVFCLTKDNSVFILDINNAVMHNEPRFWVPELRVLADSYGIGKQYLSYCEPKLIGCVPERTGDNPMRGGHFLTGMGVI